MSEKELMTQQQDGGFAVLYTLNQLGDVQLKELLRMITATTLGTVDPRYKDLLDKESTVTRSIKNQKVQFIKFSDGYSSMKIEWSGISYKPEHGNEETIFSLTMFTALARFLEERSL